MKKIISLFLTLYITATMFSSFTLTVFAESGTCGDNVYWQIENGVLTFSGNGKMMDYTNTFSPFENLDFNTVVFEDGITYIGDRVLYSCRQVENIIIADSVIKIGHEAFSMTSITNIRIPDSVVLIGKEVFRNCYNLSNVTLSDNLVYIPCNTFYNCNFLRSIVIPEKVSQIAAFAFMGTSLESISIPQSTLLIGQQAFGVATGWFIDEVEYTGIKNIYYGGTEDQWNNIKIISGKNDSYSHFTGNEELEKAVIHYNNNIPYSGKCGDNATWEIQNNILSISGTGEMYDYCTLDNGEPYPIWLTYDYDTIQINEGITRIGACAFDETVVSMEEYDSAFGHLTDEQITSNQLLKWDNESGRLYFTIERAKKVILPKSLSSIGSEAFVKCNKLTDVFYAGTEEEWHRISGNQQVGFENVIFNFNTANGNKDFSNIKFESQFFEYNGTEKELLISGTLPEGATVTYKDNKASEAGTYTATVVITAEGYNTLTLKATMTIGFKVNNVILPLEGYEIGKPWDNCWTFAQNVYQEIWATDEGEDLLRALDIADKKITEKNVRNFILSSELGANIRLEDGEDVNIHSLILVQKDNEGFTVYHGNFNGAIYFTYYTYSEFAEQYADYKYFAYISFPNAPEYSKVPQNITVDDIPTKTYGDADFTVSVTPDTTANLSAFTYASSNTDVAEIAADGTITIKAVGETDITVTEPGNDEYAVFTNTQKLVVNKKGVIVTSVDLDAKTAVFDGVLSGDTAVALNFDKLNLEIIDAVDETTSNVKATGFELTGDKSENYTVTTTELNSTIATDNVVTVTATADNGTVTGAGNYIKGSSVTVTAVPSSGYNFTGWYIENASVSTNATYTFTADEDTDLVAKFERRSTGGGGVSTYTVKFETNGGSKVSNKSVRKNTPVSAPAIPSKNGYTFAGWYSDEALTTPYDFSDIVKKNITLYAKWIANNAEEPEATDKPEKPADTTFSDVKTDAWYADAVKFAVENGLMNGVSNTEFAPDATLTRAMLVTILYRNDGEPETADNMGFEDVATGAYYEKAVAWAKANGIVDGISDTEFAPDANITREQIAAIMHRYATYKNYDVNGSADILDREDYAEISDYAVFAMEYMVASGLMNGKTNTTLDPQDNATRAEIATILQRFITSNN